MSCGAVDREFSTRDASVPSSDVDRLTETLDLLSNGEGTEGAADHLYGITALLNTWTVPDDVHAAMLTILANDADTEVLGTTTDRAGRPAVGLRATSHATPWFDVIALVSTETGRIIGVEEVYNGLKDELSIPTGTITSYTLWESEQ